MDSIKQERTVIHLQIDDSHWYFGNIKGIFENFDKDKIGIGYGSLRNYGLSADKPYVNTKKGVIIRKGMLITTARKM